MTHPLFDKHRARLDGAVAAIATRGYWSAFSEMPSPKAYGETAPDDGKRAFEAHLGKPFDLGQPGQQGWHGGESSPYGIALGVPAIVSCSSPFTRHISYFYYVFQMRGIDAAGNVTTVTRNFGNGPG